MVIHIDVVAAGGAAAALEAVFVTQFKPAISTQEGFVSAELLRPESGNDYRLAIRFEDEALRQKWVATELHGEVWNALKRHTSGYAVSKFLPVEAAHG